jgi:thiol-disulfide isomerase/thioredoxin
LTPEEEKVIADRFEDLSSEISITCNVSDDHRTDMFSSFCEQLSRPSPAVVVTYRKADEAKEPPSIEINKRLIYHAIPEGPELAPFLEALSHVSDGPPPVHPDIEARLKNLKAPCSLKLFIAPECPFCPKMVQALAPLALINDLVKLTIIDGLLFPEMAEPLDIKSAPTLLLDDRMRWTGQTPLAEIVDVMLNQDPSLLSAASIEGLLGDGRADLVAQMMLAERKIFPAFIDMLMNEKWSVRLGAMVVMEEIIELDKGLAEQCIEPLWKSFPDLNKQVRGDVVYILGEAGTGNILPRLEAVLTDTTDVETMEVVKEAIETITQNL